MADDERRGSFHTSPPMAWGETPHIYPHSHHGTPAQEFSGFSFNNAQLPMEPNSYRNTVHPRPMPLQLQPLIMPQWPSMLSSSTHGTSFQPVYQPLQPIQPLPMGPLQTPISASSSKSASTPRRTLTDADRKRMCQYAEENPNSKQTEIGKIFGVERSTVSKVLQQKEKYLLHDDGRRSPVKRSKGRSPDIERALAVWAKNQERKGVPLTEEVIRDQARAFATTSPNPDSHQTLSSSWIEKFKLKNNLMGARSRKGSLVPDDAEGLSATSSSQTPSGASPVSSPALGAQSPIELRSAESQESLKNESPDSYLDFHSRFAPFHSQSNNSLNSAFTDTAPSSFSPGPLSPTSPFFTPDSGTAPGPFVQPLTAIGPLTARPILPASSSTNAQRPRSQTFPLLDQYMSGSADLPTPKYISASMLDSPMEDPGDLISSMGQTIQGSQPEERQHTVSPSETMRPPPLPAHILETKRELTPATLASSIPAASSPEEARRALELVMNYLDLQPDGFVSFQESRNMTSVLQKLTLHSRGSS